MQHWHAVYGIGEGFMCKGDHKDGRACYAIPTKDRELRTLPLDLIQPAVRRFLGFADMFPDWIFPVTRIGCGLAGYKDEDIAPMFVGAPECCIFDPRWEKFGLKPWRWKP